MKAVRLSAGRIVRSPAAASLRAGGWTLLELLLAIGLAAMAASLTAAVFHAVIGGLARSTACAARHHVAGAAMERLIEEFEAAIPGAHDQVPADFPAWRLGEIDIADGLARELEFLTWTPQPSGRTDETELLAVVYRMRFSDGPGSDRQLIREQRTVTAGLQEPEMVTVVLPPPVEDFKVGIWSVDQWTAAETTGAAAVAVTSDVVLRVVFDLRDISGATISVTGLVWRAGSSAAAGYAGPGSGLPSESP